MANGRSPRIEQFLTIWTLLLIGLVLVEIMRLPPGLTVLLVPYLVLMARHWIGRLRQPGHIEPAMPPDDAAGSPSYVEQDKCAESLGSDGCFGCDDSDQPTSPPPTEEPAPAPSRRVRARRRPKVPEAEPPVASWLQVRPGRFVRVKELQPGEPADESDSDGRADEPHGDTPPDEVEMASISPDTGPVVPDGRDGDSQGDATPPIIPGQPGEGSSGSAFPPDLRNVDGRGDDAWNGSWIVRVPQSDLDT